MNSAQKKQIAKQAWMAGIRRYIEVAAKEFGQDVPTTEPDARDADLEFEHWWNRQGRERGAGVKQRGRR